MPAPLDGEHAHTLVIRPSAGWRALALDEVWRYRELLLIFAWRDLKVRYRQTILGAVWVLAQPLLTTGIFTLLFARVAKFSAGPVPYPVFVLSGLLIWSFVSNVVTRAGNSLIGAAYLLSKVYFPRLVIPFSSIIVELVDMGVSALLIVMAMIVYRTPPAWTAFLLPIPLAFAICFGTGAGLWVAALNVEYRDVRVVIPFILQIGMYAAPVVYPLHVLSPRLRTLALLNPMTGILESFRGALFGLPLDPYILLWPAIASLLVLVSGLYYFRRMERLFADVL